MVEITSYEREEIKKIMKQNQLFASKKRSQNFLLNQNALKIMADAIDFSPLLLEIGPGLGHFTAYLLEKTEKLIAVEIDKGFYQYLKEKNIEKLYLYHADFLSFSLDYKQEKITVVGNIPYAITSEIILHLLRNSASIQAFYLLMQKEAWERIQAPPGHPKYGKLSVLTHYYTENRVITTVGASSFFPVPKVDSVFVEFKIKQNYYDKEFEEFVQKIFQNRRKTLGAILKKYYPEKNSSFSRFSSKRPENLSSLEISELYQLLT